MRFVRIILSSSGHKELYHFSFTLAHEVVESHCASEEEKLLFLLLLVFQFYGILLYLQRFFPTTFIGITNLASVIFPKN